MKNSFLLLIVIISILTLSCKKDEDKSEPNNNTKYKVTFTIDWNSTDFPTDYPSNAHFSKLVGWSHQSSSTFLSTGTVASSGIKNMAETGSTSPLDSEINSKINNNEGLKLFIGSGLSNGVGKIELEVEVNEENPSISLVSMIAPSPDWYIGVVNINLYNGTSFINDTNLVGQVYDAGTDDGTTFKSDNVASSPQEQIKYLTTPPLGNGTSIDDKFCKVFIEKI